MPSTSGAHDNILDLVLCEPGCWLGVEGLLRIQTFKEDPEDARFAAPTQMHGIASTSVSMNDAPQ